MGKRYEYSKEELIPVVAKLAERYAGYEHTSITYEKAQMLMEAVLYCIGELEQTEQMRVLSNQNQSASETYELGYQCVLQKVEKLRLEFNMLMPRFEDYGLECLSDTVEKGIPEFLKWYDPRYAPQETILTLDYPVLYDYTKVTGVDAVWIFLRAVTVEQQFLQKFDSDYIREVLCSYHTEYSSLFENICGMLLPNIMGHLLLAKPFAEVHFSSEEQKWLADFVEQHGKTELTDELKNHLEKFLDRYYHNSQILYDYLSGEMQNVAWRMKRA